MIQESREGRVCSRLIGLEELEAVGSQSLSRISTSKDDPFISWPKGQSGTCKSEEMLGAK